MERSHTRTTGEKQTGAAFAPALIILAVVLILRLPAFWTPILDVDEAQFAGFADWLLHGGIPYQASLDTKPLGIYWFYQAVFWIFGRNNMIAVHLVTALWVWLTAMLCWRIAERVFPREEKADSFLRGSGFWAALFYAVFTTTFVPKFISTSIVIVMMLPLMASIAFAVDWERTGKLGFMWLSGICWGAACLFKYQAGINLVVMGAFLLIAKPLLARSLREIKLKAFLSFLCGGAFVGLSFALFLKAAGAFEDFLRWSIMGSAAYVGAGTELTHFWKRLAVRGGSFVASTVLIWVLAALSSVRILRGLRKHPGPAAQGQVLVLIWLVLSVVPVATGGKFYAHYFLQLLPALCILAAAPAASFIGNARKALIALLIAGMLVPAVGFFAARLMADDIYRAINEENPNAYIPIAAYIQNRTGESDTIFVWGFASPIYTFSNRLGASRFLWCDWLTGRVSGTASAKDPSFDTAEFISEGSWELLFEDLEKNKPLYFVDTSPGNHHDYGKYPIAKYPLLKRYLDNHYAFEASVNGADIYRRKP